MTSLSAVDLGAETLPTRSQPPSVPQTNGIDITNANSVVDEKKLPSYPPAPWELEDKFIDEPRTVRVAVIGAGMAGIISGILFPVKVPGIDLTIYEKNEDVGGTWLENVYPGVRCDIPAHVYQSTFAPNTQWSEVFAQGAEIRDYWQRVARKYEVYKYVKFARKINDVTWDADKSAWQVTLIDVKTGEEIVEEKDFVLTAIGRFNAWKLPDYPGINDYKGLLRHASHWDPTFDGKDKAVAVIGNGASGIQLTSYIQPTVKRLDHYARNPTWIAASWAGDERTFEPQYYTEEQKYALQDPETYLKFRKEMEAKYWRRFESFFKDTKLNTELRDYFVKIMTKRAEKKPELLKYLIPDFSPNCRRLTPGPGYLEAITSDNVDFVPTKIKRFTETGIETEDGIQRDVDAVFCATGANIDCAPPFTVNAYGKELGQSWRDAGYAYTYLGAATPGFPNFFYISGAHGTGPSGTVPHALEVQITHYSKILRKVSREGIKSITPSKKAADDFVEYCDSFFNKTVLSESCSSWYNGGKIGGRIHGIWPGSANHVTIVRQNPRWEDWEYEYISKTGNRFAGYLGNGWTRKEQDPEADVTSYLRLPKDIDLRDIHESWWDLP